MSDTLVYTHQTAYEEIDSFLAENGLDDKINFDFFLGSSGHDNVEFYTVGGDWIATLQFGNSITWEELLFFGQIYHY